MAGSMMRRATGGTRGRRIQYTPNSAINVTPLVDVILVLLIVFMVTAPMMTIGVPLDLPKTKASTIAQDKEPLMISVDSSGTLYVQETATHIEELVPRLQAITGTNPDARILVRGDQGIAYGRMMEVMGAISAAGYTKVALVAQLPTPAAPTVTPTARKSRGVSDMGDQPTTRRSPAQQG